VACRATDLLPLRIQVEDSSCIASMAGYSTSRSERGIVSRPSAERLSMPATNSPKCADRYEAEGNLTSRIQIK